MSKYYLLFGLIFVLIWSVKKWNDSAALLEFDKYNRDVLVKVVDLPFCGRSNIIVVRYEGIDHKISVNKNDCIQGKYQVGDIIKAVYNTRLQEVNPSTFLGVHRLYGVLSCLCLLSVIGFIFYHKKQ